MFRISFIILAMSSALALNGCSQCSNNSAEQTPAETAAPAEETAATPEAAPAVDAAATPAEAVDAAATPAAQ